MIAGYVGPVTAGKDAPAYALTVPFEHALDELSFQFNRKGWGYISRDEFTAALKSDGIQGFTARSPEAAEQKRWQDRQRQREQRAA